MKLMEVLTLAGLLASEAVMRVGQLGQKLEIMDVGRLNAKILTYIVVLMRTV